MKVQPAIQIVPPKNKINTIITMYLFQGTFFITVAIFIYSIISLNYKLLLILGSVSLLQSLVPRSITYIRFINQHLKPLHYFQKFIRVYDEQIPEDEISLFCFHPHSIFIYGMLANANADNSKMSSFIPLSSRFMLNFPFTGLVLRLWGLQSVDKRNLLKLMKKRKNIGLVPGGFQQATVTTPNEYRVFIKNRKGFIKYALQNCYTIRPVLIYNQHKAFKTLDKFTNIRLLFNKLKMPGVFFWGGDLILFLKTNFEMITIVGKGLKRKNSGQVTNQQINKVHQQYMQEISRLHQKYRDHYGQAHLVMY